MKLSVIEQMELVSKLGAVYSAQLGLNHTKLEFSPNETCQILGLMRNGKPLKGGLRARVKSGLLWRIRRGNQTFYAVEAISNCQHIEAMKTAPEEHRPSHVDPDVYEMIYGKKSS